MSSGLKNQRRTRLKICGITNEADALHAIASGADALGFNTYPGSKRYIDLQKERHWIKSLPPYVSRVAVTVDMPLAEAEQLFALPFIDAVQFHGAENEAYCEHFAKLGLPFIKAMALKNLDSAKELGRFHTRQILLDAYSPDGFGGLGKLIDLELAAEFAAAYPEINLILSGGLDPSNVHEAIERVRPYAVDVASGVECAPGLKDAALMAAFASAVAEV